MGMIVRVGRLALSRNSCDWRGIYEFTEYTDIIMV